MLCFLFCLNRQRLLPMAVIEGAIQGRQRVAAIRVHDAQILLHVSNRNRNRNRGRPLTLLSMSHQLKLKLFVIIIIIMCLARNVSRIDCRCERAHKTYVHTYIISIGRVDSALFVCQTGLLYMPFNVLKLKRF